MDISCSPSTAGLGLPGVIDRRLAAQSGRIYCPARPERSQRRLPRRATEKIPESRLFADLDHVSLRIADFKERRATTVLDWACRHASAAKTFGISSGFCETL